MARLARQPWLLGIVSAALLVLPFSIIGPVPFWRTFFCLGGVLYPCFTGCYRKRNLELTHGPCCAGPWPPISWAFSGLPAIATGSTRPCCTSAACHRWYLRRILIAYSMVLGLYFAALGFLLTATAKAFRSPGYALLAAPFFWVGLELLSARLTKVPWDLLGYSQVGQFPAHQLGALHRCLWHYLRADRRQCAACVGLTGLHSKRGSAICDNRFVSGAGVTEWRSFRTPRGAQPRLPPCWCSKI